MDDPAARLPGCAAPRRGYRTVTPPATMTPKARRRRATGAATARGMAPMPTGPLSGPAPRHAIVTAKPTRRRKAARLERPSGSRARSGWNSLRRHVIRLKIFSRSFGTAADE